MYVLYFEKYCVTAASFGATFHVTPPFRSAITEFAHFLPDFVIIKFTSGHPMYLKWTFQWTKTYCLTVMNSGATSNIFTFGSLFRMLKVFFPRSFLWRCIYEIFLAFSHNIENSRDKIISCFMVLQRDWHLAYEGQSWSWKERHLKCAALSQEQKYM